MEKTIYQHLVSGAAWSAFMRWGVRFIGLINIIILARLLTPQDFGVVAMASIVIGFLKSSVEFGSQQLLIRQQDATDDDINAAWTIKIIQGLVVAGLMILTAPFVADYFKDERVVLIIYVLSFSSVVSGFCNMGMTLARKELDFGLDFRMNIYNRLAGFFITLAFVLYFKNYWGLVYGHVASSCMELVISYVMHPYRPRISFKKIAAYIQFSYSIVPLRIAKFINQKVDTIVVGGIAGAAQLGFYNIASEFSKMMTSEIATPIARGLYPGYAKIADQQESLAKVFKNVLLATSALVFPLGLGLAAVADEMVLVVLGGNWAPAATYIQWLGVGAVFFCLARLMSSNILIVSGYEGRAAILSWLNLFILVPSVIAASKIGGVYAIAVVSPLVSFVYFILSMLVLCKTLPISIKDIIDSVWRPAIASMIMFVMLGFCREILGFHELMGLLSMVLLGALTYVISMALVWQISGRPDGLESYCYLYLSKLRKP